MPDRVSANPGTLARILPPGTMRGIALMIASTICFATMHVLIRHLSDELHPFQIAFFRNVFGLMMIFLIISRHGFGVFRTRRLPMHGLRALLNVVAMLSFFYALSITPLARVTSLSFTAPLFAAVLSVVILGERFRLRRWSAIVVGFLGTLIILRPGYIPIDTGSMLTLLAAVFWACTMTVIKDLARTESSLTITAYMALAMSVLSIGPALYVWVTPSLTALAWLIAIGVVGTFAQISFAQSLKEADTTAVMPFDFLKLVWISIFAALLFNEIPDVWTWAGAIIVFASGFYIAWREHRAERSSPSARDLTTD